MSIEVDQHAGGGYRMNDLAQIYPPGPAKDATLRFTVEERTERNRILRETVRGVKEQRSASQ